MNLFFISEKLNDIEIIERRADAIYLSLDDLYNELESLHVSLLTARTVRRAIHSIRSVLDLTMAIVNDEKQDSTKQLHNLINENSGQPEKK